MKKEELTEKLEGIKEQLNPKNLYASLDQNMKLKIGIGILLSIPIILTLKHLWPIYILIAFWVAWLIRGLTKQKIGVIIISGFLYLFITFTYGLVIANRKAPTESFFAVYSKWSELPAPTRLWQVITGYGTDAFSRGVHETWTEAQLAIVPLMVAASVIVEKTLREKKDVNANLHGSAHFTNPMDAKLIGNKQGFITGKEKNWPNRDVMIPVKDVHQHMILVGAPGAGKSTSIFIPNTLNIAQNGGFSNLVITDPKMEILAVCGPELLKAGYKVIVFNPVAPEISNAYNMLYYADDFPKADDIILTIMANATEDGHISHWDQQSQILLPLISYHLRMTLGEKANMSHVQAVAGSAAPKDIEVVLKNSPDPKVKLNALGFFNKIGDNDKIITSVMSNLPKWFKLWTLDPVRATTSINEINFEELCSNEKVALFVVPPLDKVKQLKPLMATFFAQLFKKIQEKGRELGKLPRPLWCFLDEFANIGTVPDYTEFLTVVRGYQCGVVMGIQSISQLEENYGKNNALTIMNSCATKICYPTVGPNDAKYFSDMLGTTTIQTIEKAYNRNILIRELKTRESEKAVKRPLMSADEITALDYEEDLIVVSKKYRLHIAPAIYYKDARWSELGQECNDDMNLKERRKVFLRENRGLPPLEVPSEEDMMRETAMITLDRGEKKNKKLKDKENDDSVIILDFEVGDLLGSDKENKNIETPPPPSEDNGKKSDEQKPKKSTKPDLNAVDVKYIPVGNPFDKK